MAMFCRENRTVSGWKNSGSDGKETPVPWREKKVFRNGNPTEFRLVKGQYGGELKQNKLFVRKKLSPAG